MSTTTPNMQLVVPTVGSDGSPSGAYALEVNSSLSLVDSHDHSFGKGVQITPAGININSALSFQGQDATNMNQVVFTAQNSTSTTLQSLYVAPGGTENDLWYTDSNGIAVQITAGGAVNATVASIPGESYAAGVFTWTQAQDGLPTTPANFDIGSITIRPNVAATALGVVLSPPSGIASQYNVALPLLPATTSIMTMDSSGNMAAATTVDNSTLQISGNVLQVKPQGITATQIANATITTTQIAAATIAVSNMASTTSAVAASSGAYSTTSSTPVQVTNQSISLACQAHRPVFIFLAADANPTGGATGVVGNLAGGIGNVPNFEIRKNGTPIASFSPVGTDASHQPWIPCVSISAVDIPSTAATNTYTLFAFQNLGAQPAVFGCHLVAFQL